MNISVVIPCYNAELYLAQTLGSVLDQSRRPDQIVVVDDGSTDSSLAIARRFETACGGLVRVHSERSGSAARTRNIGASLASGDALMFLDADDVLGPDALEGLADALAKQPGSIAACPWRRLELMDGQWLSRPASCAPRGADEDALSAWMTGWYYPPCSVLWSKDAFVLTGGWDEDATVNDDGDLMMRALASGIPLQETTVGVAYYRKLPDGQTSLSGKQHTYDGLAGRMATIDKIARILEEQGRVDGYRKPISRAFAQVAANADGRYAGLCHRAESRRRQYAPSVWSRASASAVRGTKSPAGTKPMAAPPRDKVEEVRYGMDRAEKTLEGAPAESKVERAGPQPSGGRPTVSVVIPVYNRAYLLPRTIGSVLKQTFTDFEVLVVDDCSKDDPAAVVAEFQDPRLRYLRQPENRGVAAARNRGMREARAPFIAFLDDDDEWFPEKLALQVELFRRSPADVGLIYTGVETVSDDGRRTLQIPSAGGDLYRELLVRNILHGVPASGMIRRNVITDVGFFDEDLPAIEDYDYWLRICRNYKVDYISTPLVRYNDFRVAATDADSETRRSLNIKANLEARALFYRKHGAQMRKEGVAHLFLVDSANRHLVPEWNDVNGARRLALKAFLLAPGAWQTRDVLARVMGLQGVLTLLGRVREMVEKTSGASRR